MTVVRDVPGPPGAATLLLLHGLGATAAMNWGPCFGPLSAHFRVLSIDHRGHGRGLPARHFSLEQCADDAMAIAEACGAERIVAVGWSMGGMIASLAWRRHRARVAGLVLCATGRSFVAKPTARAVQVAYPAVAGLARLAPGLAREGLIRRSFASRAEPALRARVRSEYAGHDPLVLASAVRALSDFSAHEWIGGIDVPTACIVTTRDGIVPASRQRRLAAAIPGAALFEIDGDHSTCVSQSDRFVSTLLEACRDVEQRTRTACSAKARG
jgi:pimeloyl-ACP methyl ester carboxylesterase